MKTALKILSTAFAAFYMASCSTEPIYYDDSIAPVAEAQAASAAPAPEVAEAPAPEPVAEPEPVVYEAKAAAVPVAAAAPTKKWWQPAKKQTEAPKKKPCKAACKKAAPKKAVCKKSTTCKNCGSKYCSKPNRCKSPYKNKYYNTTMQSSGERQLGLVPTMKTLASE